MKTINMIELVGSHSGLDEMNYNTSKIINSNNDLNLILHTSSFNSKKNAFIKDTFRGLFKNKFKSPFILILGLLKIFTQMKKEKSNIVHFHFYNYSFAELFQVFLSKIIFNFQSFATFHDLDSMYSKTTKWNKFSLQMIINNIDKIVVHSEFSKKILLNEYASLESKRVKYIPLVEREHNQNSDLNQNDAKERLSIKIDRKVILFFGQIKKSKGLDVLLKAFKIINNKRHDIQLVIVGRPLKLNKDYYTNYILENKLEDFIKYKFKFIPDEEVDLYFNASDIVVLPYKKIYNSAVLNKAFSWSKPAIVSNLDPFMEVINHKENGFIFISEDYKDLAKNVLDNIDNVALLRQIGNNGRIAYNNKIDSSKISADYRNLYF